MALVRDGGPEGAASTPGADIVAPLDRGGRRSLYDPISLEVVRATHALGSVRFSILFRNGERAFATCAKK